MGSCCSKRENTVWVVTYPDSRSDEEYDTAGEARAAIRGIEGATFTAKASR